MNVAKQLKAWRKRKHKTPLDHRGLTQREAAERLDVPLKTYIDWEQGRREPRGLALSALLERIK